MLSSLASVTRNASQFNYTAGGTFQDALARHRMAKGLPAVALDIGAGKDVGCVASDQGVYERLEKMGYRLLEEQEITSAIESAIFYPCPQVMVGLNTGGGASDLNLVARESHFGALGFNKSANGSNAASKASGGVVNLAGKLSSATSLEKAAERPETPPPPLLNVPFRRDPDFVDCGSLLDQIYEKGTKPGARIALVGLGGVGKSQLAIECCYRIRERSPGTWVFWIHASNVTRFEQSCRDIVDRVKIPGRQDPKAHTFKLLHDWLHDERKGEWVLIFDNVDDDQYLHEIPPAKQDGRESVSSCASERPIWAYFPESLKGSIIITSRSRKMVSRMVEVNDIITVEPMDDIHAVALFEKKLGELAAKEEIIQLTAALDFIPLAIVQAAAYIKKRAPRLSVPQYMEAFRASYHQKISLLGYEGENIRRDRDANNSILVTWQISFDYISKTRPSAADLLSLMSFFDTQEIPEALLQEVKETKDSIGRLYAFNADDSNDSGGQNKDASESSMLEIFEHDILVLRDYSMITICPDITNFKMHRLVQLAMQEWLKTNKNLERCKEKFIRNLYLSFPKGLFGNWPICQMLFSHVQCAVTQQPHSKASISEWASLLHEAAVFAWTRGNFVDSRTMADKAAKARNELFGLENEKTIDSFEILGLAYNLGGQWEKAEELQLQVLKIRSKTLGLQHPSTLTSMVNLAAIYHAKGHWKEAENLAVQAIVAREQLVGLGHPSSLIAKSNLASIYRDQGRWQEAERLGMFIMRTYSQIFGAGHPNTLRSMTNLATTYLEQAKWKDAEELLLRVVDISEKVLGQEHPSTLTSIGNLASTYYSQGRWNKAEDLQLRVMDIHKQASGPEHPSTLTSMNNLASIYLDQARWKDAEKLQIQIMESRKQSLGPDHPDTLVTMNNLAMTYENQGQLKEAERLQVRVMKASSQVFGPEHPKTLTSMASLALIYGSQGRWKDAEELQTKELKLCSKVVGEEHPSTLTSIGNLASTYCGQERWKEAEELQLRVVEIRKQVLGPEHPSTLTSMSYLASNLWNQGRWKEAEELGAQVTEISKRVLGPDHPDTLTSMANLAYTLRSSGQARASSALMAECVQLMVRRLGPSHPDTRATMSTLDEWREIDGDTSTLFTEVPVVTPGDRLGRIREKDLRMVMNNGREK
ncbi:P-loop containing nucleoside triphosphate hydrolase protein [Penicillium odoratum]|uniref:P-loop containing nucleoside triphosphate hydrolase protein n=1 Tax=Penicillium odoratum TaxID=1167516 RepID=UPI002547BFDF|nr:P-loop containing nucleoside triphosphate hydrolase protein [Penicillium odoratum]KAJ5752268.1 P-loop containing nucleoside triphosphate hydrolase protein [Penicillium odoratum]